MLSKIEEMRDHALVFPTPRGGCHTLWVLGHLAYIEGLIIRHFMLGEANPVAEWSEVFDGDEVSPRGSDFPSFDDTLAECRRTRADTLALLDSYTEENLDEPSRSAPAAAEGLFDTRRHCFQFVSDHWFMHRGQLADARRAAGLERMWF